MIAPNCHSPFHTHQPLADTAANGALVSAGPTADAWARHRNLITRLYVDEEKTLSDVMIYMERERCFKAS